MLELVGSLGELKRWRYLLLCKCRAIRFYDPKLGSGDRAAP